MITDEIDREGKVNIKGECIKLMTPNCIRMTPFSQLTSD